MEEVRVEVQSDYLQRMAAVRQPILAIAELVWNAVDADATEVRVKLERNQLGGLERIVVEDNGHGIDYADAVPAFKNLGGSWKRGGSRSRGQRRLLHGKAGRGRFRAFSIGTDVTWHTRYLQDGESKEYTVRGRSSALGTFVIGDLESSIVEGTGTTVTVANVQKSFPSLIAPSAVQDFTVYFALYLRQYQDVQIRYDGALIDPKSVTSHEEEYHLSPVVLSDGREVGSDLTVVEWKVPTDRGLYLCDGDGFALAEARVGIQAPGFQFTAYLRSDVLRELSDDERLAVDDMDPDVNTLLTSAKNKLRDHFRERSSRSAAAVVEHWKRENIYPYEGEPQDLVERVERQVFDVVALNVNSYLPSFEATDARSKRLSFRLLKTAIEESPISVQRIISEVLELPRDKQQDLADLLERTTLTAIINASKMVADRLDFLMTLNTLLFDETIKERFLERSHLHKLLETRTWLFGEEFALAVSDKSLTEVLRRHLGLLGRDELYPTSPVLREDGSAGIVDLMLSGCVGGSQPDHREHLVVELKRPTQLIDDQVLTQIRSYAFAVAGDDRFRDTSTRWVFWAVSDGLSDGVRRQARQRGKPVGQIHEEDDQSLTIWVKTWGEVIQSCEGRLRFFKEQLQYVSDDGAAYARLQEMHGKYLPSLDNTTTCEPVAP